MGGGRGSATYTTVGTVSSSALLGGLIDLDVLNDQVGSVKTLGVGVGLGVLQKLEEELGRLDGPSGAGDTPLLAYSSQRLSASAALVCTIFTHRCNSTRHRPCPCLKTKTCVFISLVHCIDPLSTAS